MLPALTTQAMQSISSAVVPLPATQTDVKDCYSCGRTLPEDDFTTARKASDTQKAIMKCKACNALRNRLDRCRQCGCDMTGYDELEGEEKQKCIAKMLAMHGPELMKELTTRTIASRKRRNTSSWRMTGNFRPKEVVEKEFKDKPEEWKRILATPECNYTCPVTKKQLVAVPEYTMSSEDTLTLDEEVRMEMQSLQKIKRQKVEKAKKPASDNTEGGGVEREQPAAKKKPINPGQVESLQATVGQLNERLSTIQGLMLNIAAPGMQDHVPKTAHTKSASECEVISTVIEKLKKAIEEKESDDSIAKLNKSAKDAKARSKALIDKLKLYIEDAGLDSD